MRPQNYLYFQHYANSAGIVEPRVRSFLGLLPALPQLRLAVLDLVSDSFVLFRKHGASGVEDRLAALLYVVEGILGSIGKDSEMV